MIPSLAGKTSARSCCFVLTCRKAAHRKLGTHACRHTENCLRKSHRILTTAAATMPTYSAQWILQDARQEFTIERLQHLYDQLRKEMRPRRKRPSSLTIVDSVGHDDSGSKPHWCALLCGRRKRAAKCSPYAPLRCSRCNAKQA